MRDKPAYTLPYPRKKCNWTVDCREKFIDDLHLEYSL